MMKKKSRQKWYVDPLPWNSTYWPRSKSCYQYLNFRFWKLLLLKTLTVFSTRLGCPIHFYLLKDISTTRRLSHLLVSWLYKLEWRLMFRKIFASGGTFLMMILVHVLEFVSVPFIFIHEHPNYEIMITHHVWAWHTMTNKSPFLVK